MLPENSCQSHIICNQLQNIKSDFKILIKTHPTTKNNELSAAHKTSTSSSISVLLKKFLRIKLITAFFLSLSFNYKTWRTRKKKLRCDIEFFFFLCVHCCCLLPLAHDMGERQRRYDVCTFCRRVQAWRKQIKYFSQFRLAPNMQVRERFFCVLAHVSSTYFCKDAGIHFFLSIIAYFVMRYVFFLSLVNANFMKFSSETLCLSTGVRLGQLINNSHIASSRNVFRTEPFQSPQQSRLLSFFSSFSEFSPIPTACIDWIYGEKKKTTEVKWELLRKWKMHRKQQQQRTVDDENISKTFCAWKVKEKLQRFFFY